VRRTTTVRVRVPKKQEKLGLSKSYEPNLSLPLPTSLSLTKNCVEHNRLHTQLGELFDIPLVASLLVLPFGVGVARGAENGDGRPEHPQRAHGGLEKDNRRQDDHHSLHRVGHRVGYRGHLWNWKCTNKRREYSMKRSTGEDAFTSLCSSLIHAGFFSRFFFL